jgi:hypothetical protein
MLSQNMVAGHKKLPNPVFEQGLPEEISDFQKSIPFSGTAENLHEFSN